MAALEEFLRLVLPWQGSEETTYKSIWHKFLGDDGQYHMAGKATQDFDQLCAMARWAARKRGDVWVALATQRAADASTGTGNWKKANRKGPNLVSLKTLFIDLDAVDKNYSTTDEAAEALVKFCHDSGMPMPTTCVLSGSGGMHVYWVLDVPLPVQKWQPMANALAEAIKRFGLKCDVGCTVDSARILRVPDTYNHKSGEPKLVRMTQPTVEYNAGAMELTLRPYMGGVPYKGVREIKHEYNEIQKRFVDGIEPEFTHRVELIDIADAGCAVFSDAIDNGGRDHKQPLWHLLMLSSTWDTDPRAMAHTMSRNWVDGDSSYTPSDVDDMLERKTREREEKNLGWPTCYKFSHEHEACRACPHLSANKSPFHLLLQAKEAPSDDLPPGYHRNGQGHIMTMVKPAKADEEKEAYPLVVMDYALTDARLDGDGGFWCTANGHGDERYLYLPLNSWNAKEGFSNAMGLSRVIVLPEKVTHARRFLMSWVQKLQEMKQARAVPTTVGWTDKMDGFTYNARTYTAKGSTEAFVADDSALRYHKPVGKIGPWREAVKVLTATSQPSLDVLVASAFAGPLVALAGMPGLLLTAFSQESGVGKSTAMRIAQAVWGDPVRAMNGLDDTPNSIMKKLSDLRHIPLYWDELKLRVDIDKFVGTVFRLAQGKDKSRLDRNAMMRETGSFQTLMVVASNDSVAEHMGRVVETTTAGANRAFEVVVPMGQSALSPSQVQTTIAEMDRNYGHAGMAYAEWLGKNHKEAKRLVEQMHTHLEQTLGSTREERFWVATMAVTLIGAYLARILDLIPFDLQSLNEFLVESFHRQREVRTETTRDMTKAINAEDLLGELIAFGQHRHMLVTDVIWRSPQRPPYNAVAVLNGEELPRMQEIWMQLGRDDGVLRVAVRQLAHWLAKKGYSPRTVYDALRLHYGATSTKSTLGAGTNHSLVAGIMDRTQQYVLDIQLPTGAYSPAPGSSPAT